MIDRHVVTQLLQQAQHGKTAIVESGDLTVKLVPYNVDGNTFLLLIRKGRQQLSPQTIIEWGRALRVPSGTEWQTGLQDTAAWCEFACMFPSNKVVQP